MLPAHISDRTAQMGVCRHAARHHNGTIRASPQCHIELFRNPLGHGCGERGGNLGTDLVRQHRIVSFVREHTLLGRMNVVDHRGFESAEGKIKRVFKGNFGE